MIRSLYTAASGMKANQSFVDNISNNLSNVNTVGFKKSQIQFEDLMYQTMQEPGTENGDGTKAPSGVQIGLGTRVVATNKMFVQGNLTQTGNPLDLAVQGDGFFQIRQANGETAYTRAGDFNLSADGYLCTAQGNLVEPGIVVPEGSQDMYISGDGRVMATTTAGQLPEELGQIELARFINPAGLRSQGGNLYVQTEASGEPVVGTPGLDGFGELKNQFLESSNVQMVEEMVAMIIAQRAYEVSSKAITTSDDMLQIASGLKR
jgi:flagellar basal-body rod protein FlgG